MSKKESGVVSIEVDWSPEAQEKRRALGIKIHRPTKEETRRIEQARTEMQKKLEQRIVEAREEEYPIATGEALRKSIDI